MRRRRTLGALLSVLLLTGFGAFIALAAPAEASSVGDSAANIARSQVNYAEVPGGSGCNQYTYALYGQSTDCPSGTGNRGHWEWQWCSDFATWAWRQAGADISGLTSSAGSFVSYGQAHGTWHPAGSGYVPQPGDAVVYNYNPSTGYAAHVGIVVSSGKSTPDVVQGNFQVGSQYEVFLDNNESAALGIDHFTVAGYTSPAGGGSGGGSSGPSTGQVLGSGCQGLHIGPSGATSQVGCVPAGTVLTVDCTVSGEPVGGPYGTETVWDRTDYGGTVGFVPDAWVYTGTNNAAFPGCGGNGVAMQPGCLPMHTAPSNASTALGCVPQATSVGIDCTAQGDNNSGPYGATTLWDHMTYGGVTGYVTDAYIYTGTANAVAGGCPPVPAPAIATSSVPRGVVGRSYGRYILVANGAGPYAWRLTSGTLPLGIRLTGNGHLTGKPTRAGTYRFTARVTDSESPRRTAQHTFSLTIVRRLSVTTSGLADAVKGRAYSQTVHAAGGLGTRQWTLVSGKLPAGLTLSRSGSVSGHPTTVGTYRFTVRVRDGLKPADVATRALTLVVKR